MRKRRLAGRRGERGASMVEFSLVFMFLMTIALGGFEFGMAFRDSLAISSATREAARIGGAMGDRSNADCVILEAAAGALHSVSGDQVAELWVYLSDTTGSVTLTRNTYRPSQPTDNPSSLVCGTWFPMATSWPATSRDASGVTRDWLGVKIRYDHAWYTNFLWWSGTVRWEEDAVMHLEPEI
ncbi:MAG TPA: TadE family protein [Acidimicrobiia bacterium]